MKRFSIFIITLVAALLFAALPCGAASVNSHEVKLDDTVVYELHSISCPKKVQAVDISIYYDSTSLKLVDGSMETPALPGAVTNTELLGEVRFNTISLEGIDLSSDSVLATLRFTVIDDLSSDISLYYSVKNFLDDSKTELKDTYTFDITSVEAAFDGTAIISSEAASSKVSTEKSGDKTTDTESDDGEVEVTIAPEPSSQTSSAAVVTETDDIPSDKAIRLETADTPKPRKDGSRFYLPIFLCGLGIVVLIGIVFVILKEDGSKGGHYSE